MRPVEILSMIEELLELEKDALFLAEAVEFRNDLFLEERLDLFELLLASGPQARRKGQGGDPRRRGSEERGWRGEEADGGSFSALGEFLSSVQKSAKIDGG
jgi:hypothetical protein